MAELVPIIYIVLGGLATYFLILGLHGVCESLANISSDFHKQNRLLSELISAIESMECNR